MYFNLLSLGYFLVLTLIMMMPAAAHKVLDIILLLGAPHTPGVDMVNINSPSATTGNLAGYIIIFAIVKICQVYFNMFFQTLVFYKALFFC